MKVNEEKGPQFKEVTKEALIKLGQAKQEKEETKGSVKHG